MSLIVDRYINVVEKNNEYEIFFLDIHSGAFTDFLEEEFNYIINILSGQIRIISEGKNSELFQFAKKAIEIESGEKFQLQNVSCNSMKLLIVKYK